MQATSELTEFAMISPIISISPEPLTENIVPSFQRCKFVLKTESIANSMISQRALIEHPKQKAKVVANHKGWS